MASGLTEAYTQLIVAQADPMNQLVKQMAQTQSESSKDVLVNAKLDTMLRLQKIIEEGEGRGANVAVFQRMLDKYANAV